MGGRQNVSSSVVHLFLVISTQVHRRFNIYIWDYCTKRGYPRTARELAEEAKLSDPNPPINAKQGLLYEYV